MFPPACHNHSCLEQVREGEGGHGRPEDQDARPESWEDAAEGGVSTGVEARGRSLSPRPHWAGADCGEPSGSLGAGGSRGEGETGDQSPRVDVEGASGGGLTAVERLSRRERPEQGMSSTLGHVLAIPGRGPGREGQGG